MLIFEDRVALNTIFFAAREVAWSSIYRAFIRGKIAATSNAEIEEIALFAAANVSWDFVDSAKEVSVMLPSGLVFEVEWYACQRPLKPLFNNGFINVQAGVIHPDSGLHEIRHTLTGCPVFLAFEDSEMHSISWFLENITEMNFLTAAIAESFFRHSTRPAREEAIQAFSGSLGMMLADTPDTADNQGSFYEYEFEISTFRSLSRLERFKQEKVLANHIVAAYDQGDEVKRAQLLEQFGPGMGVNAFGRSWNWAREMRPDLARPGRRAIKTET